MMNGTRPRIPEARAESGDTAERIHAEGVRHIYRLSRSGCLGTMINASIVTFALWDVVDRVLLICWFSGVSAITLGRYVLYRAYTSAPAAAGTAGSWGDRFQIGAAGMGAMWGLLGTVLFPSTSTPHQFLVIFVIGGMTMSAAVALAPVKRVFYSFTLPALLPLIVVLFMQNDKLQILMGALAMVFTAVIMAFAVETRENVLAAIRIKFEHSDLVARLSAANIQVQRSNEELQEKIAARDRSQEALREATQKLEALINSSPLAIVLRDANGLIEKWNPAAERMFGWREADVRGGSVPWFLPGSEEEGERHRSMILRGETFSNVEAVRRRRDGKALTVSISGASVHDDEGKPVGTLVMVADITARKRVELLQKLQSAITRLLAEARTVEEALVSVIESMCRMQGWACGARWVLDQQENALRTAESWAVDSPAVREFVSESWGTRNRPEANPKSDASVVRRVWRSAAPLWVPNIQENPNFRRGPAARKAGLYTVLGFPVVIGKDFYGVMEFFAPEVRTQDAELMELAKQLGSQIGQFIARKDAEQNLNFVATHDALTLLPNRTMFGDRLSQALSQAQRYHRRLAVLFVDLDGFKAVNDNFGHNAGDFLLKEVATRLRAGLRAGDVIGRIGGDEFVVLIEEFNDRGELAEVARKIIETAAQPVDVGGRSCQVTASIGISTFPQDGRDSQTLLRSADSAMYRAKEQGKNRFQFYSI